MIVDTEQVDDAVNDKKTILPSQEVLAEVE